MNDKTTDPEVIAVDPAVAEEALLPTWAVAVLGAAAFAVIWLVSMDNGQLTGVLDSTGTYVHELFHDSRHLFGVPCH